MSITAGSRMAGDAMEGPSIKPDDTHRKERASINKYWDDKESNPEVAPPDVEYGGFNPPPTVGGLDHAKTDTSASDFMKSKMSGMFGGNSGSNSSGTGVDDGKGWADKWGGSYRNDTSGLETANKYIQYSKGEQVIDNEALAKKINQRPLYSQAKSDVMRSEIFGDMKGGWQPSPWVWPDAPKEIEAPDLSGDKYLDMIKDIK